MKKILVAVSLMTLASTAFAAKDCGELKNEIAAKLDAKGVAHYSLEIVDKGASADGTHRTVPSGPMTEPSSARVWARAGMVWKEDRASDRSALVGVPVVM